MIINIITKKLGIKMIVYLSILLSLTLFFLYGIIFYPHSADKMSGNSLETPNFSHILGTDNLGVDIYSMLSVGFFYCILIGIFSALIAFFLGSILGILAGYFGKTIDMIISSIINFFLSMPQLVVMVLVGTFFSQSVVNIVIIVALFSWASIAKSVRAKTISVKNQSFIKISKMYGASFFYLVLKHLRFELLPLVLINSAAVIGKAIISESSLAFLGLSDPSSHSFGLMISKAINFHGIYFTDYWKWWLLAPLLSLILTCVLFRLIVKELENKFT